MGFNQKNQVFSSCMHGLEQALAPIAVAIWSIA
jgi:hypothetical protein